MPEPRTDEQIAADIAESAGLSSSVVLTLLERAARESRWQSEKRIEALHKANQALAAQVKQQSTVIRNAIAMFKIRVGGSSKNV